MVEIAHEKDLYETLYVAEIIDFLDDNDDEPFDLVTATDVLPYLGALEPLFFGVADNLNAGGLFVFSSETLPDDIMAGRGFMVGPHQRFAHALSYLAERLAETGFSLVDVSDITVRMEEGAPIPATSSSHGATRTDSRRTRGLPWQKSHSSVSASWASPWPAT